MNNEQPRRRPAPQDNRIVWHTSFGDEMLKLIADGYISFQMRPDGQIGWRPTNQGYITLAAAQDEDSE